MSVFSLFDHAFGTAVLKVGDKVEPVRIAFDNDENRLVCSRQGKIENFGSLFSSPKETISLLDVELNGNGFDWTTPKIEGLSVVKTGGMNQSVYHTVLGHVTGRASSKEPIVLHKNGYHDFLVSERLPDSWEFANGLDVARSIAVQEDVYFQSDGKYCSLTGGGCGDWPIKQLVASLSLATGTRVYPRMRAKDSSLRVFFGQQSGAAKSHVIFEQYKGMFVDHDLRAQNLASVFSDSLSCLKSERLGGSEIKTNQIFLFSEGRQDGTLSDVMISSMFTFFESVDESRTMNANTLGPLLDIENESSKSLIKVRNDLVHGVRTVSESIEIHVDFGSADFLPYNFLADASETRHANFMNFVMSKANEVVLKLIGSDVKHGRWFA